MVSPTRRCPQTIRRKEDKREDRLHLILLSSYRLVVWCQRPPDVPHEFPCPPVVPRRLPREARPPVVPRGLPREARPLSLYRLIVVSSYRLIVWCPSWGSSLA